MSKQILLAAALLAGCSTQTTTPPRIVKFDDVFVGYAPVENECDWQEVEVSVFNQKDQSVSFRQKYCDQEGKFMTAFYREDENVSNNWVFSTIRRPITVGPIDSPRSYSVQDVTLPIFSIDKLGPLTPQEFINSRVLKKNGLSAGSCQIINEEDYLWKVIPLDNETDERESQDGAKYKTACELLGFQHFGIKGGIVISYPAPSFENNYLDPASITYTNKG